MHSFFANEMAWESDFEWIGRFFWWISLPALQHFRQRRRKPTQSLKARVGLGEKFLEIGRTGHQQQRKWRTQQLAKIASEFDLPSQVRA
jgi:hypothetical protein